MATRAIIQVQDIEFARLYKHWDGYPEATLQWLEDFNKNFFENRGDDPEYKFAQLVRSSSRDAEKYNLDDNEFTGWGIIPGDEDWGSDYLYSLNADGSVTVKEI